MEISQANINESTVDTKTKLTNDLNRLLQVRDKNSEMAKDWLLFITTTPKFSNLRPGEIYQAFKMAMARELLDSDGKEFNLLPELSINMTSKVLISYFEWKKNNPEYRKAKDNLLKLKEPSGPTEEERQKIRQEFLKTVFDDIVESGFSSDAWLLYPELEQKLKLTKEDKIKKYNEQVKIHLVELNQDVSRNGNQKHHREIFIKAQEKVKSGKWITIVANKCKSIFVSEYLKQFKSDFEQFKKEINEHALDRE